MNDPTVDYLLQQVYTLVKKHEEISKIRGDNFNIFSILRLESDEVRLHSRFIGEILNPNGRHDQGAKFLKLFVDVTGLKDYSSEQLDNATVIVEQNIGNIPDDYERGGRIDLVIKPKGSTKVIVIENKIYAPDQHKQLARYKNEYPDSNLLYLTLKEKEPSPESLGKVAKDSVILVTYSEHISKWIELCLKETIALPLLRETITQYLHLVKKLTGRNMNDKMDDEIISTIAKTPETIEAAFKIHRSIEGVKQKIMSSLKDEIGKSVKEKFGLESDFDEDFGKAESEVDLFKLSWAYQITFGFDADYETPWIGVENRRGDSSQTQLEKDLIQKELGSLSFGKIFGTEKNSGWIWGNMFDALEDISWSEVEDKYLTEILNAVESILRKIRPILENR